MVGLGIAQVPIGLVKLADKCVSLVAAWSRTPVRSLRLTAQSRIFSLSLTSLSSAALPRIEFLEIVCGLPFLKKYFRIFL